MKLFHNSFFRRMASLTRIFFILKQEIRDMESKNFLAGNTFWTEHIFFFLKDHLLKLFKYSGNCHDSLKILNIFKFKFFMLFKGVYHRNEQILSGPAKNSDWPFQEAN